MALIWAHVSRRPSQRGDELPWSEGEGVTVGKTSEWEVRR